ncbi:MAG TPA: TIGR04222 domain-containing membrane protein, partial [Cellvibrionaceae bacterium]|nr:TIGR04222 domain-containing membrane protein [Cellvibrionaceae bacterium]
MFPFDLPGPQFLGFYSLFGIALVLLNTWQLRRQGVTSGADQAHTFFNAPYALAYLNQGQQHCLSICAFNLIDRGLMTTNDAGQISSRSQDTKQVSHPLEHALIQYASSGAQKLFAAQRDNKVKVALSAIKADLLHRGLIAGGTFFTPFKLICLAFLAAVGAIKITLALAHGHHNIQWLIVLMFIFMLVISLSRAPRLTADGEATLTIMRGLLAQLHGRMQELKPGGFTQEATLAAALFGLAGLSLEYFPHLRSIMPPVVDSSGSSSDGGSSSGSSCSSSCSSSDSSSSCGGGGCGG